MTIWSLSLEQLTTYLETKGLAVPRLMFESWEEAKKKKDVFFPKGKRHRNLFKPFYFNPDRRSHNTRPRAGQKFFVTAIEGKEPVAVLIDAIV